MSKELDLVYIAAPYYHEQPLIMQLRHEIINHLCGKIINEYRCSIFSPISHGHMINSNLLIDKREYWMEMDLKILCKCSHMFVLMLDGWKESRGVNEEIDFCNQRGIEIRYIEPAQLVGIKEIDSIEQSLISGETNLDVLQYVVGEWAQSTFKECNTQTILAHLKDEIQELIEANAAHFYMDSREEVVDSIDRDYGLISKEAADVGLLLAHYCHEMNISLGQAMVDKFRINQERKWSTEKNENGYYSHIKSPNECQCEDKDGNQLNQCGDCPR